MGVKRNFGDKKMKGGQKKLWFQTIFGSKKSLAGKKTSPPNALVATMTSMQTNNFEILLKTFETLSKHFRNSGETLLNHWKNAGKTLEKHWRNTGEILVKHQ